MRRRIVLVVLTAALAVGCGGGERNSDVRAVDVPDLIGMQYRPATEILVERRLRWKYLGGAEIHATPLPDNILSTADDDFIVDQEPDAGEPVQPGAVIVLEVSCSMEPLPENAICID